MHILLWVYSKCCLSVDNMLIVSNDMKDVIETKRFLSSIFKMKDLGEVDTILEIKVKGNSGIM